MKGACVYKQLPKRSVSSSRDSKPSGLGCGRQLPCGTDTQATHGFRLTFNHNLYPNCHALAKNVTGESNAHTTELAMHIIKIVNLDWQHSIQRIGQLQFNKLINNNLSFRKYLCPAYDSLAIQYNEVPTRQCVSWGKAAAMCWPIYVAWE